MYLYFDKNGVLQEVINDKKIRSASDGANRILAYIEGDLEIDEINVVIKRADGSLSNEVSILNNKIYASIPYDKQRDLKFFKDFAEYQFYYYDLTFNDLQYSGLAYATITIYADGKAYAQGMVTFNIEKSVIKTDNLITQSQYQYLLLSYASRTLNEQTGRDLDTLITEKVDSHQDSQFDERFSLYKNQVDALIETQNEEINNFKNVVDNKLVEQNNEIDTFKNSVDIRFGLYVNNVDKKIANQNTTIKELGQLQPSGTDTSTNILSYTSSKGIYVATDNGHWYYWNASENKYVDGGVYQTDLSYNELREDLNGLRDCILKEYGATYRILNSANITMQIGINTVYVLKDPIKKGLILNEIDIISGGSSRLNIFLLTKNANGTYSVFDKKFVDWTTIGLNKVYYDYLKLENDVYVGVCTIDDALGVLFGTSNDALNSVRKYDDVLQEVSLPTVESGDSFTLTTSALNCAWGVSVYAYSTDCNSNMIIVDKNGNGNYTSISEAVESASNGDVIFVKIGTYENEIIKGWGKTVHLIGEDRDLCVIKNNTNAYSTPCLEIASGSVKNLTILQDKDLEEVITTNFPYAIHVEDNALINSELIIDNCHLYAKYNSAIGMGLRENCNVIIKNSDIETEHNLNGANVHVGALFVHGAISSGWEILDNQNLIVENCNLSSKYGSAFHVQYNRGAYNVCYATFKKCCLYSEENGLNNLISTQDSPKNFTITNRTFGNNVDIVL